MTTLTVASSDLATFLGVDVDAERATMILDLAMDLAGTIVSPVPTEAKAVVLTVAARAYSNPTGVTSETIGPYSTSRPAAGIYLTKSERSSLRLLVGRGGAFSIDMLGIDGTDSATDYPYNRFPELTPPS